MRQVWEILAVEFKPYMLFWSILTHFWHLIAVKTPKVWFLFYWWILDLSVVWVKSRKIVVLGTLETVTLCIVSVCMFYATVVTEVKGTLTLSRIVCVPTACWSLEDHWGTSKQWNGKTTKEWSYMVHVRNRGQRVPWHRHKLCNRAVQSCRISG